MAFNRDKIINDISNMKTVREIYHYLRMSAPDLVADWKRLEAYFLKAGLDKCKNIMPQILCAAKVKLHMEMNRPRNGSQLDPYDVYSQETSLDLLRRDVFMNLFSLTCDVLLDANELVCDQNCLNAVSIWKSIGETSEHIYEYIAAIQLRPASANYLYTLHITANEDETERRKSFDKATRELHKGMMRIEDAVCAASLIEEDNDVLVENCSVYYEFTASLLNRTSATALVIAPTPFFVRKWCADDSLKGVKVTFVMGGKQVCDILSSKWASNKDFKFIPLEKLETHLIEHGAPDYALLLFGRPLQGECNAREEGVSGRLLDTVWGSLHGVLLWDSQNT